MVRKIGVLTSGGDAPGMNSAIRSIVKTAANLKIEVIGILDGYKGMYLNKYQQLTLENTANIFDQGGTILKSSRFEEFKQEDIVIKCIENVKKEGIEAIIVIGGDGTYHGALALSKHGMKTIAIPGTIDNDISGTCKTIGFDTALTTITENISKLKDTALSHGRCLVVEVMGRHCDDLAMYSLMASDLDLVICNAFNLDFDLLSKRVSELMKLNGEVIVVVSENLIDVFDIAKQLEDTTGIESRGIKLGYIQRGGSPTVSDRLLAKRAGIHAVSLISEGKDNQAICLIDGKIVSRPIEVALNENVKDLGIYEDYQDLR